MEKTALILLFTLFINGCYESPLKDRNSSEENSGNDMWGNPVTDLSMSQDGRFIIRGVDGRYSDDGEILLDVIDLQDQSSWTVKVSKGSKKMVFGRGSLIYITQSYCDVESNDNCKIREFDLLTGEYGSSWTGVGCVGISIDRTETIVATWNKDEVLIVNTLTDTKMNYSFFNRVKDVRWSNLTNELIVVTSFKMYFINPALKTVQKIDIDDAGILKISPDGKIGAVAPFNNEPTAVKVFDLKKHQHMVNIPGSRMVQFTPDGKYMINQAERDELVEKNTETTGSYNLVITDTEDFSSEIFKLREERPVELIVPNNEQVLIRTEQNGSGWILDMKSGKIKNIYELNSYLTEYVVTSDGKSIFTIKDAELYFLDLKGAQFEKIDLKCGLYYGAPEFCKADEIMISKDEKKLLLGMVNGMDIAVMDLEFLNIDKFYRTESTQ